MHEALHSYDRKYSSKDNFIIARQADSKNLNEYLSQNGEYGRKETFAEVGASVFSNNPNAIFYWPHLYKYFKENHY